MKISIKIGIIAGLLPVLMKCVLYYGFGIEEFSGPYNLAETILVILAIPASLYFTRKTEKGGMLSFKGGIKSGLATTGVAAIIITVFTFLYFKYLNADYLDQILEKTELQLMKEEKPSEEIDKSLAAAEQFFSPFIQATSALFGTMIAGGIATILATLVFRRE